MTTHPTAHRTPRETDPFVDSPLELAGLRHGGEDGKFSSSASTIAGVTLLSPGGGRKREEADDDDAYGKTGEKPLYGKRPRDEAVRDGLLWVLLTIYILALAILGRGKTGYVLALLTYVFVSLRLLARHVCITRCVYVPLARVMDGSVGRAVRLVPERMRLPALGAFTVALMTLVTLLSPVTPTSGTTAERIQSLFGVFALLGVLYWTSADRFAIPWHTVVVGLFAQYLIAIFTLRTSVGVEVFGFLSRLITAFLETSAVGFEFLIGKYEHTNFAVNVLPAIVFFCAFISIVYYWGGMQYIVMKMGWAMMKIMDTSGSESVVAAASPFVGQGESALLVKPFVEFMTKSELHSTMTSGFATIAGSVLLAYIKSLEDPSSLLTACMMSIPASLLISKMRYPEKEESISKGVVQIPPTEEKEANFLHAAGNGAATGMHLIILIAGSLLSIVSLFAVANFLVGWIFDMISVYDHVNPGLEDGSPRWITIEFLLSYLFAPFAWCIGIPGTDARLSGQVMAVKMVVNEFVAYTTLKQYKLAATLTYRSVKLLTFALCGFANVASIGIQIGCLGAIAPTRKKDLAELAFSAMLAGTASTWLTAAVAGTLI